MDAIKYLERQHRVFEALFSKYEADPQDGKKLVGQMERAIIPHAIVEETYVYPILEERVPNGEQLRRHAIEEHSEVERTLKSIASLEPESVQFDASVRQMIESVRHHIKEEEEEPGLFGMLRASMHRKELEALGATLATTAKLVPTRAHPAAPDRAPGNLILGAPMAVIDRVRDAIEGRTDSDQAGRRRPASRKRAERKSRKAGTRKSARVRSRAAGKRGSARRKRAVAAKSRGRARSARGRTAGRRPVKAKARRR